MLPTSISRGKYVTILTCLLTTTIFYSSAHSGTPSPGPESSNTTLQLDLATAVRYALQWNREIAIAEYQPDIAREQVEVADSVYDISAFSKGGITRGDRPTQSRLDTGSIEIDQLIEDRWLVQAGLKKHVSTGGTLSLYQELDYLDSNSEFVEPNPQNTSRLRLELTQPLLKNIGDQESKAALETAQKNVAAARENVRLQINDTVYNVVYSYRQLQLETILYDLNKQNLQLAEDILKREKERLALGVSKNLDVDRAHSAIEKRKTRLLRSLNRMQTAMYQLRMHLNLSGFDPGTPGPKILPTDLTIVILPELEIEPLVEKAFMMRPELLLAEKRLETAEINMKLFDHLQLPELNARADYTLNSLGTSEGDALEDVYNDGDPSWSVWLEFEYPFGNNGANAEYRKAHLEFLQAKEEVEHTRDIVLQEIYSVVQEIDLLHQQIDAAYKAQQAAERVLESELASYELSRTSNRDLLQSQDILALAKGDYSRAVADFNLKVAYLNKAKGTLLESILPEQ